MMIGRILCKLSLHDWDHLGVFERRCRRCARVEVFKFLAFRWVLWYVDKEEKDGR